jgi:hypothetical protein
VISLRLARLNRKNGSIWINPDIQGEARTRVKRHMKVFQQSQKEGKLYKESIKLALKAEHKGMTKHQVFVYEGRLSAIARKKT